MLIPAIDKTLVELRHEMALENDPQKIRQLHNLIAKFEWLKEDIKQELKIH